MLVELEHAPKSAKWTLQNLMQLYLHDMSEFQARAVDEQGLFHYRYLDSYWEEPGRYPFLIRVDGSPAGFALVRFDEDGRADMAEFFLMRGHRRRGVGSIAARHLFDAFPGPWEIREEPTNFAGQQFWRRVVEKYTAGQFEDLTLENDHWRVPVQRFDSRAAKVTPSAKEA